MTTQEERGRILVVDDNRLNRMKLLHELAASGHEIAEAADGTAALEALRADTFDLVLLDIVMPGLDGFQVLQQMKNDPNLRDIPVIVISAVEELESVVRCIEMGAEDYLQKPFNSVLLRARLRSSLAKKKLRDLERAYLQQEMFLRQSEKLVTLGRMSAGLAHELNNPAAAVRSGAAQLRDSLPDLQALRCRFDAAPIDRGTRVRLEETLERASTRFSGEAPLARADRESALEDWLQIRGVERAWETAPGLAALGLTPSEMEGLTDGLETTSLTVAAAWLSRAHDVHSSLAEIAEAASRISGLVAALKSYAYMDQAAVQSVDVHQDLENTLIILSSKLKHGITIQRDYAADLPRIQAYGAELNQVWTNLIDNAAQAMGGTGAIAIRTRARDGAVTIEVEDNGPGIPEEIEKRIFDPFFTTKPPGEGSGLGLSIVHSIVEKHGGRISVRSRPGSTCFEVLLPTESAKERIA